MPTITKALLKSVEQLACEAGEAIMQVSVLNPDLVVWGKEGIKVNIKAGVQY